jgi:hypothetical protein
MKALALVQDPASHRPRSSVFSSESFDVVTKVRPTHPPLRSNGGRRRFVDGIRPQLNRPAREVAPELFPQAVDVLPQVAS